MKIDKKLIEELKNYLDEFGLTEIEYQDGSKKIKVSKSLISNANITAHKPGLTKTKEEESGTKVSSPIIGTAYLAPEPGGKKSRNYNQCGRLYPHICSNTRCSTCGKKTNNRIAYNKYLQKRRIQA